MAEYSTFSISDEAGLYQLTVDGYSGDAGNAMMTSTISDEDYVSNGRPFSTPDSDNDVYPGGNCADDKGSGWWFGYCSTSNINNDVTAIWADGAPVWDIQASRMLVKYIF